MAAAELEFVATLRDEATQAARSARQALDAVGGDTKPIVTALKVDAGNARAEVDAVASSFDQVPAAADQAGGEAGGSFAESLASSISGAKGLIGGALGALGIGAAVAESMDTEAATDKLAASLGASSRDAARYGKVAGNLYAGAWGDSLEDVTSAVGAVKSSIAGIGTGAGLQDATAAALDYATVFDVDVTRAASSAGQVIRNGFAKDARGAFDLLTAASQRVPAQVREDVLDAADEYGTFFRTLGFDGPQAFSVLAKGAGQGMLGIDKAGDAVKEFTIRATDGSDLTQTAMQSIGLNADDMANRILAGGGKAKGATDKIIQGILGIEDPAKRANTAIALFGTPLEDLNVRKIPAFLRSLTGAGDGLGKVEGASKRAGQTLNDNARTNLVSFGRQMKQQVVNLVGGEVLPVLSTFASFAAGTFGPAVGQMGAALGKVTGFFREHKAAAAVLIGVVTALTVVTAAHAAVQAVAAAGGMVAYLKGIRLVTAAQRVATAVQWALTLAMQANPLVLIATLLIALGVALVIAYKKSETFRNIVNGAFKAIRTVVVGAVQAVAGFVTGAWNTIKSVTTRVFGAVRGSVVKAWQAIKNAVGDAVQGTRNVITNVFGAIRTFVGNSVRGWRIIITAAWNAIKSAVSNVVGAVRSVVVGGFGKIRSSIGSAMDAARTAVGRAWDAIKAAVGRGVSNVVDLARGLIGKVKGALSGAGSALSGIGADLVRGLIGGIGDMAGAAVQKVKDVVGGAIAAARNLLDSHSPSRVFRSIGRDTIRGYVKGLEGNAASVNKTIGKVFGSVRKFYNSKIKDNKRAKDAADRAIKSLTDETDAIRENAQARAGYAAQIKAVADVVKTLRGAGDLAEIGTVNDAPLTSGLVVAQLQDRLKALRTFGDNLRKLARKGFARADIEALAAKGAEAGGAMAAALAASTPEQVAAITAAQKEIRRAAGGVGDGLVKGIRGELRGVEKVGHELAGALIKAMKKRLGIRSPSRVAAEDGRQTARGLARGILEETRTAEVAAEILAARVAAASVPSLPDLGRMAADASAVGAGTFAVRTTDVVTIRHEIVSPDSSISRLTANELADLIARDPIAARTIETALVRIRRRRPTITATR